MKQVHQAAGLAVTTALLALVGCEGTDAGECELDMDPLRIVQAVLLETPGCEASSGPLPLATENTKLTHGQWDIAYVHSYVLCVEIENNSNNPVEVTSQEVSFDWGEDLGFDLGPGSVPWELGITDQTNEALSLTVEPKHRWVECLDLVPAEVGQWVVDAQFWRIQLDPEPNHGRRFGPEFSATLKLHGTITNGPDVETDPFPFRISVEWGWLADIPDPTRCCDALPDKPCRMGQETLHDCRIQRDVYDGVFGLDSDTQETQCCPVYPDGC